jgi:hypothetical protein
LRFLIYCTTAGRCSFSAVSLSYTTGSGSKCRIKCICYTALTSPSAYHIPAQGRQWYLNYTSNNNIYKCSTGPAHNQTKQDFCMKNPAIYNYLPSVTIPSTRLPSNHSVLALRHQASSIFGFVVTNCAVVIWLENDPSCAKFDISTFVPEGYCTTTILVKSPRDANDWSRSSVSLQNTRYAKVTITRRLQMTRLRAT